MRRTVLLTVMSDWLPKLVAFLGVLLVARRLGASEFAFFAVALSWTGYAWWAIDLGQAGYSIRTLAASSGAAQQRLGSEIFSLYLALAAVVSAGLVAVLLLTRAYHAPDGRLLLAMSPYLLAYALFPDWWLRARGQLLQLGAANWAAVVTLVVAWILVPSGDGVAYALGYGLSPLAGATVAMYILARHGSLPTWTPSWTAWLRHLRTSLMFGAAGVGGQISVPLALATMASTGNPRAAGAFALGMRASAAAANALWLLLQNALPHLLTGTRPVTARTAIGAAMPPLLGVGVAVLLWHPLLAPALGSSYAQAGGYAALGALLLVVWGPKYVIEIGLVATFGDAQRIVMNIVPPVLVVAAVLTGLQTGRSWAMPTALLCGEGLAAVVGYALLRRRTVPELKVPDVEPTR
ncbi:MAG: Polysaccharide biosynthesis protein [Frankiales bacterium]|nr:Polysaccharide biosynthesis protein [Frankiales bacterium]